MKKTLLFFLLLIAVAACNKDDGLEKGTNLYKLANALAIKYPVLEPDKNKVLVRTDAFNITTAEFLRGIYVTDGIRAEQMRFLSPKKLRDVVAQWAEELAMRKVLLLKAREANIVVSDTEADSAYQEECKAFGSEQEFLDMLNSFEIDKQDIRREIKHSLLITRYFKHELADEIRVTPEEIEEAYGLDRTATVRHILLKTEGKDDSTKAAIYNRIEKILGRAGRDEDFAELARKYSEDEGSKDRGGLYEDFERGEMVRAFEDAAFSVPVGEISDIVTTPYGYHIIKVLERKKATQPFEEVEPDIRRFLKAMKLQDAKPALYSRLKSEAHLEFVAGT